MVSGALRWKMRGKVGVVLLVSELKGSGSAYFAPLSLLPSSVRRSITHTLRRSSTPYVEWVARGSAPLRQSQAPHLFCVAIHFPSTSFSFAVQLVVVCL